MIKTSDVTDPHPNSRTRWAICDFGHLQVRRDPADIAPLRKKLAVRLQQNRHDMTPGHQETA
jgi:hypothetical protein